MAGEPVFELASMDLVETDQPCFNVARFLPAIKCACCSTASSAVFIADLLK